MRRSTDRKNYPFHLWPGLVFLALFFVLATLSGCTNQEDHKLSSSAKKTEKPVTYRLKWLFNASTIGDLWARDHGLFSKRGLNVNIKEGGAEHDAIEEIELGRANFGVASADQVIRAVSRGGDCLVIAQIFQVNPLQWIYNKSRVWLDPARLAKSLGKLTVGITYGGNDETIFMALAGRFGLDPDNMHLYAITYDYTPFWKGKVDLWPCYRNTQGITLQEKMARIGEKAGFLDPCTYGVCFVANSLVTSKKYAREHKETVRLFRQCIISGWRQAVSPENLDEAAKLLAGYEKGLSIAILKRQIQATAPLISGHGTRQPGHIDADAWRQTEEIMFRQGLIKKRVDVQKLLFSQQR